MDDTSSPQPPDGLGQRATEIKFLIRDRAGQFTSSSDAVVTAEGITIRQPAAGAESKREKITCTLRRELFDQLLTVRQHQLRQVLTEYLLHCYAARPHRSLGQLAPTLDHRSRSTSPSTGSAGNKSWPDSHANTRSPPDSLSRLQDEAGHCHDRVFEPNTLQVAVAISTQPVPPVPEALR